MRPHPLNPQENPVRASILSLWETLEAAGYQQPPPWRHGSDEDRRGKIGQALDVWAAIMGDEGPQWILAGGLLWLRQDRRGFWPTPGQVLQALEDERKHATPSGDDGWGMASRLMSRWGTKARPCETQDEVDETAKANIAAFLLDPDPVVASALKAGIDALGSWRVFGRLDETDAAARASFRSAYERQLARVRGRKVFAALATAIGAEDLPALPAPPPDLDLESDPLPELERVERSRSTP